jgi:hypothetical protein
MQGVAALSIKHYEEHRLSAMNDSVKSIKNREYILEIEEKFVKPSGSSLELGRNIFVKHLGKKSL